MIIKNKFSQEDKKTIGDLVDESDLLEFFNEKPSYSQKKNLAVGYLINLVKKKLVDQLCDLTKESDLQSAILEALFKYGSNLVQSFKLELLWNKYQIFLPLNVRLCKDDLKI